MKIVGTGLLGLVGSRIVEILSSDYQFENLSRSTGADITDMDAVRQQITHSDASFVLHLAAKTHVDECEKDKEVDSNRIGTATSAWGINVGGTENIVAACNTTGKKLIYISTDFVFDGTKDFYREKDMPQPINWYGMTKWEGEKRVSTASCPWAILRIAYPYRDTFPKTDFVRAIVQRLQQGQEVKAITDHVFTPTFVDDIAMFVDALIKNWQGGVYHVTGSMSLTPFDAAQMIARQFGYNTSLITPTTREVFFKDRAQRPFKLVMRSDRIEQFNLRMHSFEEGLTKITHI